MGMGVVKLRSMCMKIFYSKSVFYFLKGSFCVGGGSLEVEKGIKGSK